MTVEVSMRNVAFTYLRSDRPVLHDINLEIESGSVTAFVGQVGAGKSTLFQMLNGLIPTIIPGKVEGEIVVAGQDVHGKDPAFMAQFINLVFDDPALQIINLTSEEDVAFGPANLNLPREEVWERTRAAMKRVGLDGFEKRNPRSMSGGEQQLLALAGILAMRPRIIALDEPVAMLDPIGKARVLEAIRELKDTFGATILIAESGVDIEPVCEFADQMVLMHKGRILASDRPGRVFARRDIVTQSKLKIPQVTRVVYQLDSTMTTVPVTLEEGRQWVSQQLDERGGHLSPAHIVDVTRTRQDRNTPNPVVEPVIQVKNLHHVFPTDPPVHALKGIDLDIQKGDFVALLGQNGSGKSTLSFHLVGVEKPTNPDVEITVDGLNVVESPLSQVVRRINYLFQNPANQLFCQTFGEEVIFGPLALGFSPEEAEEQSRAALRQVGLEQYWEYFTLSVDKSIETLLSLATVLAIDPQILIADEPTGGLDYATGNKLMEILQNLNRQGRTIVVITHDMELAIRYARRIVILRYGEVWMDGTPQDVFGQTARLAETRLAPPQVTRLAQSLADYGFPNNVLSVEEFVALTQAALANGKEA